MEGGGFPPSPGWFQNWPPSSPSAPSPPASAWQMDISSGVGGGRGGEEASSAFSPRASSIDFGCGGFRPTQFSPTQFTTPVTSQENTSAGPDPLRAAIEKIEEQVRSLGDQLRDARRCESELFNVLSEELFGKGGCGIPPPATTNRNKRPRISVALQNIQRFISSFGTDRSSISRGEMHLSLTTQLRFYFDVYKQYIWSFCPLPPAVFEEQNMAHYLSRVPEEACPMSLSSSLAVCVGAALMGDNAIREEFEARTLQQLIFINNYPCLLKKYGIAMVAYGLSCYYLYWKLDQEMSAQFLKMAAVLCKELNMLNSIIYSRCLYATSLQMSVNSESLDALKKEAGMAKHLQYQTGGNCQDQTSEMTSNLSLANMEFCSETAREGAVVIANLRLHRENVRLSLYPKERVATTGPLVESLLDALSVWEEAMTNRFRIISKGSECIKAGLYYLLSITGLKMEIYRLSGECDVARKYAVDFLKKCQSFGADYLYVLLGIPFIAETVLDYFFECHRYEELREMIETFKCWSFSCPIYGALATHFDELVKRKETGAHYHLDHEHEESEKESEEKQVLPRVTCFSHDRVKSVLSQELVFDFLGAGKDDMNEERGLDVDTEGEDASMGSYAPVVTEVNGMDVSGATTTTSCKGNSTSPFAWDISCEGTFRPKPSPHTPQQHAQLQQQQQSDVCMKESFYTCPTKKRRCPGGTIAGMSNEESLALVDACKRYQHYFRKFVWPFCPLHPAVLDESNIKYFIASPQGRKEKSPLAFSFYVSLCRGAFNVGDACAGKELLNRADCTLRFLLCKYSEWQKDYSIAMGAISLACVVTTALVEKQTERMKTYLQIASQICKNLNAYNSDVFVRYLFTMAGINHSVEERDRIFYFLRSIENPLNEYVPVNGATPKVSEYSVSCLTCADKPVRCFSELQQTTPMSQRNLRNIFYCYTRWTAILAGEALDEKYITQETLAQLPPLFENLDRTLVWMKEEQAKSGDPLPKVVNLWTTMMTSTLLGKYYAHIGDTENALKWMRCSVEALEKKKCRFLSVGIPRVVHYNLKVLTRLGATELRQRLLDATVKWDASIPILKKLREDQKNVCSGS